MTLDLITDLAGYYALVILGATLRRLPFGLNLRIGRALGSLAYHLGVRRSVVRANLACAFPERPPAERERIALGAYREAGMSMIELARNPGPITAEQRELVELEGSDHIDRALARGRGVILLGAHFGSWDAAGARVPQVYRPIHVAMRRQTNLLVDAFYERTYRLRGAIPVPKKETIERGYQALRENGLLVLLADQDAGRHGVLVPFFGRPASTPKGPALFAARTGAALIFTRVERDSSDPKRRKVVFEPLPDARPGAPEEDEVERLMAAYMARLEAVARLRPDQYFWFHRRWKSAPAAGAKPA